MEYRYVEKYFINPAIEYGIKSYMSYKENGEYERCYTFEMSVIKALTIIYGEKSILLPYRIDNERAFECNLLMYDLKESEMLDFIKYLNQYYLFMRKYKSHEKVAGLISEIERIIIDMIDKRSKRKSFTEEEILEFDTIFNPSEGELKQLKALVKSNDGLIIKKWEDSKYGLTNTQLRIMAINPNLLDPNRYSRCGLDIKTVALLSSEEIDLINAKIIEEENRVYDYEKKPLFKRRDKIVLTTGNGFVDKLMLLSIITTEIMIGLVIASIIR